MILVAELRPKALFDDRLSWKSRGIYMYLISEYPMNYFTEKELVKRTPGGMSALRSGLKELIKYGYLDRVQIRDKGRFIGVEWHLHVPMF